MEQKPQTEHVHRAGEAHLLAAQEAAGLRREIDLVAAELILAAGRVVLEEARVEVDELRREVAVRRGAEDDVRLLDVGVDDVQPVQAEHRVRHRAAQQRAAVQGLPDHVRHRDTCLDDARRHDIVVRAVAEKVHDAHGVAVRAVADGGIEALALPLKGLAFAPAPLAQHVREPRIDGVDGVHEFLEEILPPAALGDRPARKARVAVLQRLQEPVAVDIELFSQGACLLSMRRDTARSRRGSAPRASVGARRCAARAGALHSRAPAPARARQTRRAAPQSPRRRSS